mmetsp:Transcript_16030/g.24991  ORF Transcript_16030/g.24991 Transcript_16030/m.24991 type:complete len:178 (+) Transcript_16030:16-549(+)
MKTVAVSGKNVEIGVGGQKSVHNSLSEGGKAVQKKKTVDRGCVARIKGGKASGATGRKCIKVAAKCRESTQPVLRPTLCSELDSSVHQALLPLDESWRCDRGMELYDVQCAKNCGNIFGNEESARHYSIRTKKNGIFVCSNVANGTCCFAICKECYSIAFGNRPTRGRRSRIRSSRL